MQDIARYTLDDLKAYYKTYYVPVNAFIVIAGDFKKEEVIPMLEGAFGPIGPGIAPDQQKDIEEPQARRAQDNRKKRGADRVRRKGVPRAEPEGPGQLCPRGGRGAAFRR